MIKLFFVKTMLSKRKKYNFKDGIYLLNDTALELCRVRAYRLGIK